MKELFRESARELGLAACGFARAGELKAESERFERWVRSGCHGSMEYLARNMDVRRNPAHDRFFPGGRTVIMFSAGYAHREPPSGSLAGAIAAYARGKDYHAVLLGRLKRLVEKVGGGTGGLRARIFIDSAPVMEKVWAARCGLGWIGRNGLLVNERLGSAVVLGGIVTDADLEPDAPVPDGCGSCRACIDACPTGAVLPDRTVDASRCLSYVTTQKKDIDDDALRGFVAGRSVFGCDECQRVCPYNERLPEGDPSFAPLEIFERMSLFDASRLDGTALRDLIRDTALERMGPERILQNIRCAL